MRQTTAREATSRPEEPRAPTRRLPAWLLSTIVHLLVLILLGICWRVAPKRLAEEPDRAVDIVLARQNDNKKTTYFQEPSNPDHVQTTAQNDPVQASPPADASPPPLISGLKLPDRPGALPAAKEGDSLLKAVDLTGSGRPLVLPESDDSAFIAQEAASRRKSGPGGPAARVSLFGGRGAEGHSFVFVIDRSKSMGSEGLGVLSEAVGELDAALKELQPYHQFQIIAYHQHPLSFRRGELSRASEKNKQEAIRFFKGLVAFGGTGHESALLSALRLKPDVIFLLTDGGDPYLTEGQLQRICQRAGRRTSIHCLQFGLGALQEENQFMRQLAARTSGSYGYVDMSKRPRR